MSLLKTSLTSSDKVVFWCFGTLLLGSLIAAISLENIFALAIPLIGIALILVITNYRFLYFLLLFSLPFSMQIGLPGGLTMDVPSEPLMLVISGCFIASLLAGTKIDKRFFSHPLVIIVSLMYLWALAITFISVDTTKSIKYLLAKAWYIIPFLLFTGSIVKNVKDIRRILWYFFIPLSGLVILILLKHSHLYFAFDAVQQSVSPFFLNHVIYAATVALFIPYVVTLILLEKAWLKPILLGVLLVLLIGVGYSYTRASWLSLPLAGLYFLAIRFQITKIAVTLSYLGAFIALGYMIYQNNFMLYAPDYEKTIWNGDNLEKHLEATYKFEDVSGMERVYRWVAAINMVQDKPLTGSGPSTFYPEYKKYTVKSFQTYVSNNPEKSTTHNYFLLQLAEQGIIGLILFLILIAYLLILPETLYFRTKKPEYRAVIVGTALCLLVIIFHLTLNELIEVDKIGSFFFISIAFLIKLDIWTKDEKRRELLEAAGK